MNGSELEQARAEQEARDRAKRQEEERAKSENKSQQDKHDKQNYQNSNSGNSCNQDPYEVLGVTRDMSKADIRKKYLKLMNEYAPDHVAHLSDEFQKMAHEKCISFNLAWEKIQKNN